MCVVVVTNARKLVRAPEFPRGISFAMFKKKLVANDFTVYEFIHAEVKLPQKRQVIFTHESIRNQIDCTTAAVTAILADCSAFKYRYRLQPDTGLQHSIWHSDVTFIKKQRSDSLSNANLLGPVKFKSTIPCVQVLLNLLSARPDVISMNRAQVTNLIAISFIFYACSQL